MYLIKFLFQLKFEWNFPKKWTHLEKKRGIWEKFISLCYIKILSLEQACWDFNRLVMKMNVVKMSPFNNLKSCRKTTTFIPCYSKQINNIHWVVLLFRRYSAKLLMLYRFMHTSTAVILCLYFQLLSNIHTNGITT